MFASKFFKKIIVLLSAVVAPVAFAAAPPPELNVFGLMAILQSIIGVVLPFLIGLAVLFILYGIVNYIRQSDNEEKRVESRLFIIWGVISLFVMVSVWGLVNILYYTFNLNNTIPTDAIPLIPLIK